MAEVEKQDGGDNEERRGSSRLEELVEELVEIAEKTPAIFHFTKKVLINEDVFYNICNEIVASQPDELVEAQRIIARQEDILKNAHDEAQHVLTVAQRRLEELTSEQEVVKQAKREAERIIHDAEVRADQIRVEAMEYVYQKMEELERQFASSLSTIKNGKILLERELSQAAHASEETSGD